MELDLSKLKNGILGLEPINSNHLGLAAAYLLEINDLYSGVEMTLIGSYNYKLIIKWDYIVNDKVKRSYEPKTAADYGAIAISLLIVDKYLDYNTVVISYIDGKGFDYSLGNYNEDTLVFENDVPLEITGIKKETKYNIISKRAREKERRFEKKGIIKKAYISVVEFNTPKSKFYLYNYEN